MKVKKPNFMNGKNNNQVMVNSSYRVLYIIQP